LSPVFFWRGRALCVFRRDRLDARGAPRQSAGLECSVLTFVSFRQIDVWDADSWNLRGSYRTGHAGNVFCVKYVPHQKQSFVTAAADGDVRLTDLVKQEDRPVLRPRVEVLSSTPGDMTLKIEFLPQAPLSFLTTHRDGTIRLTDLRNARRTGTAGDAPEQTIVHLRDSMFFSLCFDPTNTHTFAAGCGNHFVRLYDLRMGSRPYEATPESGCVKLWTDPTLLHPTKRLTANELHRESRRHVTDVRFSSRGDLLVNYADNDVVYFAADDPDKRDGMICTKVLQVRTLIGHSDCAC
jgi:WD40 repeat protein